MRDGLLAFVEGKIDREGGGHQKVKVPGGNAGRTAVFTSGSVLGCSCDTWDV